MWNLHWHWCQTPPNKHNSQSFTPSPNADIELMGRVNEADIFVRDIWVMALIDTGAQVTTINQEVCEQHRYNIHPMKQMLHLQGMGGFSIPYLGI